MEPSKSRMNSEREKLPKQSSFIQSEDAFKRDQLPNFEDSTLTNITGSRMKDSRPQNAHLSVRIEKWSSAAFRRLVPTQNVNFPSTSIVPQ